MLMPSSSKSQASFKAHCFLFFRNSMILSLILMGVSPEFDLGRVDLFSSPSKPYFLKSASQYFIDLAEKGQTLAISLIDISLARMGFIHLYFSSFVDLGMVFICPQITRK